MAGGTVRADNIQSLLK